jgi:hypothetical protein
MASDHLMRDHLAHRYFDTAHTILQATVDDDLPELERTVCVMAEILPEEDQPGQDTSSEGSTHSALGHVGGPSLRRAIREDSLGLFAFVGSAWASRSA